MLTFKSPRTANVTKTSSPYATICLFKIYKDKSYITVFFNTLEICYTKADYPVGGLLSQDKSYLIGIAGFPFSNNQFGRSFVIPFSIFSR